MTHHEAVSLSGRWLENAGFTVGLYLAYVYVTAEAEAVRLGTAVAGRPMPWGTIAVIGLCVAPKMLGRQTAGRIWEGVSRLVPKPPGGSSDR